MMLVVDRQPKQPAGGYTLADHPFASRGGLKLDCALSASGIDVSGLVCADLGSSTGGFTSCLLLRGAKRVYAVDTGYGVLDYGLRMDERVVVMERSNALHADRPAEVTQAGGVDLVVIDLGWTKQVKALAAAVGWLSEAGRVITLIKPHYEQPRDTPERRGVGGGQRRGGKRSGKVAKPAKPQPLSADEAHAITRRVLTEVEADASLGLAVLGSCESPIRGSKGGNLEVLAWLGRRPS